jgi:hypothetical protein
MHYLFVAMMATMGVILAPFVLIGTIQAIRWLVPALLVAIAIIFLFSHPNIIAGIAAIVVIGAVFVVIVSLFHRFMLWCAAPPSEETKAARMRKEIKKNPWWGLTDDEISRYK